MYIEYRERGEGGRRARRHAWKKGPAIRLTFRAFSPLPAGEAPRRRNPVAGKARSNIL